jgi:hypothetical protein
LLWSTPKNWASTSKNVEEMKKSTNPDVKRLLGVEGDKGKDFGLANDWMAVVIKQVGNYGEIFERNVGKGSAVQIERGSECAVESGRSAIRAAGPLIAGDH